MNYYTTIDGRKMDKRLLDLAQEVVAGQGDGRISGDDARKLFNAVRDGGVYTDVEKTTMEYIRDNFRWTESADKWFRGEIATWASSK